MGPAFAFEVQVISELAGEGVSVMALVLVCSLVGALAVGWLLRR